MSKCLFGGLITDARGKLGGHILSKNSQGNIISTSKSKIFSNSIKQINQRLLFRELSTAWRLLTTVQRLAWEEVVPLYKKKNVFGQNVRINGYFLFMQMNLNLIASSQPKIQEPKPIADIPANLAFLLRFNNLMQVLHAEFWSYAAQGSNLIYVSKPLSAGAAPKKSDFRLLMSFNGNGFQSLDITQSYTDLFTQPKNGMYIWSKSFFVLNSGIKSVPLINPMVTF